ncbi:DUF4817 domain-containing protein [Trichonephila clavipes]|nr:DUF4817 domain-containing protein [Trichonephila clavipes]
MATSINKTAAFGSEANPQISCGSNKTAQHVTRSSCPIDLLKDTFDDRLISRFGPVNWPPRSCDLTPLDYFLWGYVKSLVYANKPEMLDHLEDNIRRVIADIRPQMLENSSKIGRPDWTTSEPAVAVLCQKSYLKYLIAPKAPQKMQSPENPALRQSGYIGNTLAGPKTLLEDPNSSSRAIPNKILCRWWCDIYIN